jgi:hypothetical protein
LADTLSENHTMLGVFHHAGFTVETNTEWGTVYLRFGIMPTDSYLKALAGREQTRRIVPTCPLQQFVGASEC